MTHLATVDVYIRSMLAIDQVDHIAGGATQNSIRVAQWLLGGQVMMILKCFEMVRHVLFNH